MTLHVAGAQYRVSQAGGGRLCFYDAIEFPPNRDAASKGYLNGELLVEVDHVAQRWAVEFERPSGRVVAVGAKFAAISD